MQAFAINRRQQEGSNFRRRQIPGNIEFYASHAVGSYACFGNLEAAKSPEDTEQAAADLNAVRLANFAAFIVVEMAFVRTLLSRRSLKLHEQTVDDLSTVLLGTLTQVVIQHFSSAHTDVFSFAEGLAYINLTVAGGNHLHLGDLAVDDVCWQIELVNHAEGNSSTAGLHQGIRHKSTCHQKHEM